MTDNFPEVYKTERPLHDDWQIKGVPRWLQPWSYIPRRWTGLCLMMPPMKVAGNAEPRWIEVQVGYPIAPDAQHKEINGKDHILGMDPVHPAGQWSVQSFYSSRLGRRIPCYFSFSKIVFGRRLHFNGPLKPDVTVGDFFWWGEISLTWTKVKP